jgi:hypothetical protein
MVVVDELLYGGWEERPDIINAFIYGDRLIMPTNRKENLSQPCM